MIRTLSAGMAFLAAILPAGSSQFSAQIDGVPVDVLVTRSSRPERGLTARDFEVRDNGVLQQVQSVSFEQLPLDVILTLDLSRSVAGERLAHLRTASDALMDSLVREDRAALLTFGDRVQEPAPLSADLGPLRAAIAGAEAGGDTALVDAVYAAIARGDAGAARTLVMLFSDGIDTASWLSPARVLGALAQSDAVVYAIWTGAGRPPSFLREVVDASGGRVIGATEGGKLQETFLSVLNEFRHRYLITYSPKGVVPGGWHALDVRVRRSGVTVRARPGYLAAGPK